MNGFKFEYTFNGCLIDQRGDLENNKIENQSWSGEQVLIGVNKFLPFKSVKEAFNIREFDIWAKGGFGVVTDLFELSKH